MHYHKISINAPSERFRRQIILPSFCDAEIIFNTEIITVRNWKEQGFFTHVSISQAKVQSLIEYYKSQGFLDYGKITSGWPDPNYRRDS
jgi:hypothetical protein